MIRKAFSTPVLISVVTGVILTESFGDIHECSEFVVGHPIWTHEFASKDLQRTLRQKILAQHPDLDVDLSGCNQGNWTTYRDDVIARLGESREITQGQEERATDPVTSLQELFGDSRRFASNMRGSLRNERTRNLSE